MTNIRQTLLVERSHASRMVVPGLVLLVVGFWIDESSQPVFAHVVTLVGAVVVSVAFGRLFAVASVAGRLRVEPPSGDDP